MFAQESVMDIKKVNHLLEQFEKTKTFKRFFSTLLRFDEDLDCFVASEKWRDKEAELLTAAWWMFAEVATAQPVPESFEQAYSEIFSPIVKQPYPRLENGDYKYIEIDQGWKLWQAATVHAVPEWISVKDKLPGFNQSVLSCDGFETCVAEYLESCKNEYGVFFEEGFWINGAASIFENVTHWMPLPEAIEALEPTDD